MHKHCVDDIAPGTRVHIGAKFLSFAGANCTSGTHFTTWYSSNWPRTMELVNGNRRELMRELEVSAQARSNRKGEPFTFDECRQLMTQGFRDLPPDHDAYISFPLFLQLRFVGYTFILGALRTTQFQRFNAGGVRACRLNTEHYVDGMWRPFLTGDYCHAKTRNGVNPTAPDTISPLSIVCTCRGGAHKPLIITWKTDGTPREIIGDIDCWYNLFQFVRLGQAPDCTDKIMRIWNKRQREFGKSFWSAERIKTSIATWLSLIHI